MSRLHTILLAVLSGVLLGVSWPATGSVTPFVFIGFVPLLFIDQQISSGTKKGSIFWLSFLAFFLFNLISTWWIFCVDENLITKLISIGTPVLLNPLFMAITFKWFSNVKKRLGEKRGYWSFVLFWLAFEYLHLNWSISDPWLTLGNVFANRPSWVQWFEFTGALGGSLWILIVNLFLFFLTNALVIRAGKKSIAKHLLWLALLLVLPIAFSVVTYINYSEKLDPVNITLVQPNIDPYNVKFTGDAGEQIELLLALAEVNSNEQTNYVVGPETALPYSIWIEKIKESPIHGLLKDFNAKYPNADIVLGASMGEIYHDESKISPTARKFRKVKKWYDHYNSAIQVDQTDSVQIYHKSKLVLGVETMPFPQLFKPFQDLIFDLGGTTGSLGTQKERIVFQSSSSDVKIAPVICWESVYGEHVGEYIKKGANLIFILTNDGWWDETPGYIQHFHYSRLRAIETRRSVARSANTGISCFVNQRGDVLKSTEWWVPTSINGTLNTNDTLTFYANYGDYIGRVAAAFSILLLIWTFVKRFSTEKIN